jgi:hypothetical protein
MFSVLVCRCVHWGLVGLLVMWCAVLAQAASKALTPDQEAFVERHGNYPQLLEREKAFWQALNDQDSTWIQHETDQFLSQDFPLLQAARSGESMDLAFALGPCHYASISLSQAIAAASDRGFPRPMPRRPDFLVPPDIRQTFAENIRRCELIKRHPRSKRLVGAGLG